MNSFYVLEPENGMFGRKWAYADIIEPSNVGEAERCPVCGGAVGLLEWLPPHRIKLSSAKPEKWGDFVWGAGFSLLVSDRFKEIYKAEELTGITKFYPQAEIVRMGRYKSGDLPPIIPRYYLIRVPWGTVNQDDEASILVREFPERLRCPYCRSGLTWRKQQGIFLEESSWNGEDIFEVRGSPAQFIVSERFKQVNDVNGLKNICLIPAEKYCFDERRPGLWYVQE